MEAHKKVAFLWKLKEKWVSAHIIYVHSLLSFTHRFTQTCRSGVDGTELKERLCLWSCFWQVFCALSGALSIEGIFTSESWATVVSLTKH